MTLRPHTRAWHVGVQCLQQLGHVVVGYGHAFGDTGGARGVDEVRDVIGGRRLRARTGVAGNAGIVEIDDRQTAARPAATAGPRW